MIQIDMEMPATCYDCPFCYGCCSCCLVENSEFDFEICDEQRMPYCPLKEVNDNGGWISVKDRLPNCNGLYLVWRPHFFGGEIGEPVVCYFDGQNTWHDSYGVDFERILNPDDVTHWMPLPKPPKEAT